MQNSYKKQQGLTFISLIFVLGLIAFFVLLGLKVVPIYTEHAKVTHALATLENKPGIENKSKRDIWNMLNKQFGMDYVYHIKQKHVKITSSYGYMKVRIKYHVKEQLIANLSVWVDFDNSIEVGTP
ncbi:MAG: DUF4845 domain-containing protein [Methyloprofundus sp.]|nr:DUF4845 domain-containing protein [Methyloprofundus sp.]